MSGGCVPDWRDPAAYHALRGCDASHHAWEWVRREPSYRAAYTLGDHQKAACFGLHRLEDPDLCAMTARPLWTEAADPFVITVHARPTSDPGAFDIKHLGHAVQVHVDDSHGEHLIVGNGRRSLQLNLLSGTFRAGPVQLLWRIPHPADALPAIVSLRRLVIWHRTGRLVPIDHPSAARAARWSTLLRVQDALIAGASQREIAQILFGGHLIGHRWRVEAESYRLRIRRLVRSARQVAESGGAMLLRPPSAWRG